LGCPIEPSLGWKGEVRGDKEDDGLGAEEWTRKVSTPDAGVVRCGELGAEASSSSRTSSMRTSSLSSGERVTELPMPSRPPGGGDEQPGVRSRTTA
jgi:hypothetical protein